MCALVKNIKLIARFMCYCYYCGGGSGGGGGRSGGGRNGSCS